MEINSIGCRYLLVGLMIGAFQMASVDASPLSRRNQHALGNIGDRDVVIAVHHERGRGQTVAHKIGETAHAFPFIATVMGKIPASAALTLAESGGIRTIEIVDDGLVRGAYNLIQRLELLYAYRRMGMFRFAALSVSLAPSRMLINRRPLRTGEQMIRRALEVIANDLQVPVFIAVGNDGPVPGLMNPWAKGKNLIAVTAANMRGTRLYDKASRPASYGADAPWHLFSAWGIHTVGALDRRATKTPQMLEDEKHVDLAALVGPEHVTSYSVRSGTSFAVPHLVRNACPFFLFSQHLQALADVPRGLTIQLEPHIRAIIDTAIDRNHPAFQYRQADRRQIYSSLSYAINPAEKVAFHSLVTELGLDLDLTYRTEVVVRFLRAVAKPISGADDADGHGFVSFEASTEFIRRATLSDVVTLFAEDDDPRIEQWQVMLQRTDDSPLVPLELGNAMSTYCERHDLVLPLSLH